MIALPHVFQGGCRKEVDPCSTNFLSRLELHGVRDLQAGKQAELHNGIISPMQWLRTVEIEVGRASEYLSQVHKNTYTCVYSVKSKWDIHKTMKEQEEKFANRNG